MLNVGKAQRQNGLRIKMLHLAEVLRDIETWLFGDLRSMAFHLHVSNRNNWRRFVVCCLLGVLTAWTCETVSAQQVDSATAVNDGWHFRYDLFQMLIEERGIEVLPDIDGALADPRGSLIVIAGTIPVRFTASDWERLIGFVQKGGNLLVATESNMRIQGFGKFATGPATVKDSAEQYQGFNDCLLLPLATEAEPFYPRVRRIVTNRSGWFVPNPIGWLNWEVLAALPADCSPREARLQSVLALGKIVSRGGGVVIASADASIFSNGMLWHGDNAVNAICVSELLCAGDKRSVVFIADSMVLDSYRNRPELRERGDDATNSDRELPEPELSKALRLANAIAREVAASNVINEALTQQPRPVSSHRYFRAILVVLGACFFLWLLVLLLKRRINAYFVRPRQMQPSYEIRNSMSNPLGNFQHAAGYLAREFCFELTGSARAADWQQYLVNRLQGHANDTMSSSLAKIVDLACRGCHTKLTRFEFQQLGKTIQSIRERLLASKDASQQSKPVR
jgi:hypothetical protein